VDFELTDEQRWLSESVAQMLARELDADGLVPLSAAVRLWSALGEFGALQIVSGDEGLGAIELSLIARELGGRLAPVPYVDSAAIVYALAGSAAVEAAGGSLAAGVNEPGRHFAPAQPMTTITDGRLTGGKAAVAYASFVDLMAITAAGAGGLVVALVPPTAAGVALTIEGTLDPSMQPALVTLNGVEVDPDRIVVEPAATSLVERLAAVGGVLACAEAVGAAAAVLGLARDYAAQRRQFGRTIGSFQALRHMLADMYVGVESSWSSVLYAAASLDENIADSARTASIAKAYASRATQKVAQDALQVFGGIAFTAEHPAHRFLRRIAVLGSQFGTAREHERSLGRSLAHQMEVTT